VSGSVRRAGLRVRITAQLVDAEAGTQLWAERYDRTIEDLFVVQDEVTRSIAAQLMPQLTAAEGARAALEAPGNLDAWSYYQRALAERLRPGTPAGLDETQHFLEQAIQADPEFAPAISFLANARATRNVFGWTENPKENRRRALELSRRAADLAPHHPTVLHDRGVALAALGQVADGESLLLRSVDLNPSNAHGWAILGYIAVRMNRPQVCIERVQRAISLSPHDPRLYLWDAYIASAYFVLGQDAETLLHAERSTRAFEGVDIAWIYRAVSLAALDRQDEALAAAARYRDMWPNTTHAELDRLLVRTGPSVESVRTALLSRFWALFEQTAAPLDIPAMPSDADR
jgi:adenylate cyclase